MGYKCTALGCKSGYSSQKNHDIGEKITFHSYPLKDQNLCDKWIRANPRKDFIPSKHSRLCSLHFTNNDFVEMHNDSNTKRRLKYTSEMLSKRYLKKDAVPSIFPNAPGLISNSRKMPRSAAAVAASAGGICKVEQLKSEPFMSEVDEDLSFFTLEDIRNKLLHTNRDSLLDGFELTIFDGRLLIYRLAVEENVPKIRGCITVKGDLSRSVSLDGKAIDDMLFNDLVPEVFQTMSQILNTMELIKSWCEEQCEPTDCKLEVAIIKCLKEDLDTIDGNIDDDCKSTVLTHI